jgi:hypothetical protein
MLGRLNSGAGCLQYVLWLFALRFFDWSFVCLKLKLEEREAFKMSCEFSL